MDAHTFALHSVPTVDGCSRGLAVFGRRSPWDVNAPGQKRGDAGRKDVNMAGLWDERLLREWQGGGRAADDETVGGRTNPVQSRRGGAGRERFFYLMGSTTGPATNGIDAARPRFAERSRLETVLAPDESAGARR